MQLQVRISIIVALSLAAIVAEGKILTEKPDFLNPCSITDHNFNSCFSKNVEALNREWKTAIPGLESVGSIDPLSLKRVYMDPDPNSPIAIKLDLTNVEISGLSGAVSEESSFNTNPLCLKVQFYVPKIIVSGDYNISGHILTLPLNGNGRADLTVENIKANFDIRFQRRDDGGHTFTDVERLLVDLQEVGGLHLDLDNGANGDRTAEDASNAVLTENAATVFEVLRPSLNGALGRIMKDRWTKIFAYVPATYLFKDLPTVT